MRRVLLAVTKSILALAALVALLSGTAFLTRSRGSQYELVSVFGRSGSGPGEFSRPTGLKVYENGLFVADSENNRIQVFDLDGGYRRQFGSFGMEPGRFNKPWNLMFFEDELYVAVYQNHRVDIFDPDGTFKRSLGVFGDESTAWGSAASLVVDADRNFVAVDFVHYTRHPRWRSGTGLIGGGRNQLAGLRHGRRAPRCPGLSQSRAERLEPTTRRSA